MKGDRLIDDMLPEINQLIQAGAQVYLKWTCPGCGERVMANEPNCFYEMGFRHTDPNCGHVYMGRRFGYLVVAVLGVGQKGNEELN